MVINELSTDGTSASPDRVELYMLTEVRKDEQVRLKRDDKDEEAKMLKKSKFILTSSRSTLEKKDNKNGTATLAKYKSLLKKTNCSVLQIS